jgi:Natural resistance-associated macrophage protein
MIDAQVFCTPPEGGQDRGMRIALSSYCATCSESKPEIDAPEITSAKHYRGDCRQPAKGEESDNSQGIQLHTMRRSSERSHPCRRCPICLHLVMYFIILATAATLHRAGQTDIDTAAQAAEALRPLAGQAAYILMALGLIGSGMLAVPILTTSGAYAICEAFGWKWGLDKELRGAKHFYLVIGASTIVGLLINYLGVNPVKALFWTAVINGFLAPPLLVLIMLIANNKAVMGQRVNSLGINVLGWVTIAAMFAAAIGLVLTWGRS